MSCEPSLSTMRPESLAPTRLDLPDGVPPLHSLYLYVSGSCNLACRHCWITPKYQPDGQGGPYISLDHVAAAVRQARPLGLRSVKLTGGEPTLHPAFRELVEIVDVAGIGITIESNGTLIDPSLAYFLRQTPHFGFISISLDGATAETHDHLRSVEGSFGQAIAGIENLVNEGIHPQVICTLHAGNKDELAQVIQLAESLGCSSIKFNILQPMGRAERFVQEQGIDLPQILELGRYVQAQLRPRHKLHIVFDIPLAFHSIGQLLRESLGHCAVKNILGVLATGELSLCGVGLFVPEMVFGHLDRDELYAVWCHSPALARLREQIPMQLEGVCGRCLHRDLCLGMCVANTFHDLGILTGAYRFCDHAEALGLFPMSRKRLP